MLARLFHYIKSLNYALHGIFITGITKQAKGSVFSGLNNVLDISLNPLSATLLGYTQEEITHYFKDHITAFAQAKKCSEADIVDMLTHWYNGYRFTKEDLKVFNPYSASCAIEHRADMNYWIETANPSILAKKLGNYDAFKELANIRTIEQSSEALSTTNLEDAALIPLLFQTGYLTIVDYNTTTKRYSLDFPNAEVHETFNSYILAALTRSNTSTVDSLISRMKNALINRDIDTFCSLLQGAFAHIPYQLHIEKESYYHSIFQLIGTLLALNIESEVSTDKGRIDLVLETPTTIYLFELKVDKSGEEALKQIEAKKYYEKYLVKQIPIMLIGLSFNPSEQGLSLDCASKELLNRNPSS